MCHSNQHKRGLLLGRLAVKQVLEGVGRNTVHAHLSASSILFRSLAVKKVLKGPAVFRRVCWRLHAQQVCKPLGGLLLACTGTGDKGDEGMSCDQSQLAFWGQLGLPLLLVRMYA